MDQIAEIKFAIEETVADAQYGAFLGPRERVTFQILDHPAKVALGDLNPRSRISLP